ncbi:MAG: glycosyltransferase family 4 protein [Planctomycetes bacterium]|nr:glycosyltransferase family 4 protein [Planctomycetota bacterium]
MKRVLFLTRGGPALCSGSRVRPYLSRLRADGWDAVERPGPPETVPSARGLWGRVRRLRALAGEVAQRKRSMRDAADFDLVYVERELVPYAAPRLEKRLAGRNRNLVYDLDGAAWIKYGAREPNPLAQVAGLAHAVIAGNEVLMTWALRHNRNVHLIPTPIDTERWKPDPPRPPLPEGGEPPPPVVVWIGAAENLPSLRLLGDALKRARAAIPKFSFRIVSETPPAEEPLPGTQFVPWSEEAEVRAVASADIGILPLPDDAESRARCGVPLLRSMACGLPSIASPVGENTTILEGGAGLLARTPEEWEVSLLSLLRHEAERRAMGERARARALERYSVEALYPAWKSALESGLTS